MAHMNHDDSRNVALVGVVAVSMQPPTVAETERPSGGQCRVRIPAPGCRRLQPPAGNRCTPASESESESRDLPSTMNRPALYVIAAACLEKCAIEFDVLAPFHTLCAISMQRSLTQTKWCDVFGLERIVNDLFQGEGRCRNISLPRRRLASKSQPMRRCSFYPEL